MQQKLSDDRNHKILVSKNKVAKKKVIGRHCLILRCGRGGGGKGILDGWYQNKQQHRRIKVRKINVRKRKAHE